MLRRLALRSLFALTLVFSTDAVFCAKANARDVVPDDEAIVRGMDASSFRYEVTKDKVNYLRGMDVIATGLDGKVSSLPVYQLLDKKPAAAAAPPVPPAGIQLADVVETPNEVLGRNTWMLWCGGNEGFWDWLAGNSYGFTDLLKLVDSRTRATRFNSAGVINEPGMKQASKPDQYGLWIDVPSETPADKVPEKIYGRSSGVIGLRIFDNPRFADAKDKWDAKRYYDDPTYYNDPDLVRPYRVGMSCAFCHASFHPLIPPANLAEPRWDNISGNIGAQYLRVRAIFGNLLPKDSFVYHLLDSQPPGTVDTSLIASDNINNPNAMNAIFNVPQRVVRALINPPERIYGASKTQPGIWGDPSETLAAGSKDAHVWERNPVTHALEFLDPATHDKVPQELWDTFAKANLLEPLRASNDITRPVPRILFDGADSIGPWGALARVYLNIGTFWEQWILLHKPLVGFQPQKPFRINDCSAHSVYWQATQERVAPLRDYFLKITPPMPLLAARGGAEKAQSVDVSELSQRQKARVIDVTKLARGRKVFAQNCIVCHSSIQTPLRQKELADWAAKGEPWDHDPGHWLSDAGYLKWAEEQVELPDFWRGNYLSTDYRIPVTLVRTNSARAMATNGIRGHMWEDFTSASYQDMPSVGSITYFNPFRGKDGGEDTFTPRHKTTQAPTGGGGVGFYRVPSLISIWATAPLLHNNSLGKYNSDPSLDGRLEAFDDAMRKLLLLTPRTSSSSYNDATPERLARDHGLIWRTPQVTYLNLPGEQVPSIVAKLPGLMKLRAYFPSVKRLRHLWLPSAVLLVAGFACLIFVGRKTDREPSTVLRRKFLARWLGYTAAVLGLVIGFLLYFLAGRLGDVRLGPIPKGTPVSLLANLNPEADPATLKSTVKLALETLAEIESKHLSEEDSQRVMREKIAPELMKVSRCPDFVMDKGHYFEWFKAMSDADKEAVIELLKTF